MLNGDHLHDTLHRPVLWPSARQERKGVSDMTISMNNDYWQRLVCLVSEIMTNMKFLWCFAIASPYLLGYTCDFFNPAAPVLGL